MEIGFAALILFVAVVLPVLAYVKAITRLMKLTVNVQKAPVPLDPNTNPFPTLIGEHFDRAQSGLRGQGFEPVADYALAEMIPNAAGFARMFVNRAEKEVARGVATCFRHPVSGWSLRQASCHFETMFVDGTGIVTSNTAGPRMLPRSAEVQRFVFADIRDVARLHPLHQAIVARFADGRVKELVFETRCGGDPMRYHAWSAQRTYDRWQRGGYYHRDEQTGILRLTLKGAVVAALYLLPPGRQVLKRRRERKAKRLLRELDVRGLAK
jgi:hypothetical protein